MRRLKRTSHRIVSAWISTGEIFKALRRSRFRGLTMIVPVLLVIGLILAVISSAGVLAPFVYPLF